MTMAKTKQKFFCTHICKLLYYITLLILLMTFYTISTCITHDISSSYFLCTSYISMYKVFVQGRGRSKLLNLCPIPIVYVAIKICSNQIKFKYQEHTHWISPQFVNQIFFCVLNPNWGSLLQYIYEQLQKICKMHKINIHP